jgi:hypothetical protein
MKTLCALAVVFVAVLTVTCGGGGPGVGDSCGSDKDCGSLQCYCVSGQPGDKNGYIPGVCSERCSSKAACAHLGSNMSCAEDFCSGINVCLAGYSGSELP